MDELFTLETGESMVFRIPVNQPELHEKIRNNGGQVKLTVGGEHTINLCMKWPMSESGFLSTQEEFSFTFIDDCIKFDNIMSLVPYRVNKRSLYVNDHLVNDILYKKIKWSDLEKRTKAVSSPVNKRPRLDFDDVNDSVEPTTSGPVRKRNIFTHQVDKAILEYILKKKLYMNIGGRKMWQDMEYAKAVPGFTWQSLKERYRKKILPNLRPFKLSKADLKRVLFKNSKLKPIYKDLLEDESPEQTIDSESDDSIDDPSEQDDSEDGEDERNQNENLRDSCYIEECDSPVKKPRQNRSEKCNGPAKSNLSKNDAMDNALIRNDSLPLNNDLIRNNVSTGNNSLAINNCPNENGVSTRSDSLPITNDGIENNVHVEKDDTTRKNIHTGKNDPAASNVHTKNNNPAISNVYTEKDDDPASSSVHTEKFDLAGNNSLPINDLSIVKDSLGKNENNSQSEMEFIFDSSKVSGLNSLVLSDSIDTSSDNNQALLNQKSGDECNTNSVSDSIISIESNSEGVYNTENHILSSKQNNIAEKLTPIKNSKSKVKISKYEPNNLVNNLDNLHGHRKTRLSARLNQSDVSNSDCNDSNTILLSPREEFCKKLSLMRTYLPLSEEISSKSQNGLGSDFLKDRQLCISKPNNEGNVLQINENNKSTPLPCKSPIKSCLSSPKSFKTPPKKVTFCQNKENFKDISSDEGPLTTRTSPRLNHSQISFQSSENRGKLRVLSNSQPTQEIHIVSQHVDNLTNSDEENSESILKEYSCDSDISSEIQLSNNSIKSTSYFENSTDSDEIIENSNNSSKNESLGINRRSLRRRKQRSKRESESLLDRALKPVEYAIEDEISLSEYISETSSSSSSDFDLFFPKNSKSVTKEGHMSVNGVLPLKQVQGLKSKPETKSNERTISPMALSTVYTDPRISTTVVEESHIQVHNESVTSQSILDRSSVSERALEPAVINTRQKTSIEKENANNQETSNKSTLSRAAIQNQPTNNITDHSEHASISNPNVIETSLNNSMPLVIKSCTGGVSCKDLFPENEVHFVTEESQIRPRRTLRKLPVNLGEVKEEPLDDTNIACINTMYSRQEDIKIIRYVASQTTKLSLKGNLYWIKMTNRDILPGRPWQGIKERFLKRILPNLSKYLDSDLGEELIDQETFNKLNQANSKRIKSNKRKEFSLQEDIAILTYIITPNKNRMQQVTGKQLWVNMTINVECLQNRHWESVKGRFLKHLKQVYLPEVKLTYMHNKELRLLAEHPAFKRSKALSKKDKIPYYIKKSNRNDNDKKIDNNVSTAGKKRPLFNPNPTILNYFNQTPIGGVMTRRNQGKNVANRVTDKNQSINFTGKPDSSSNEYSGNEISTTKKYRTLLKHSENKSINKESNCNSPFIKPNEIRTKLFSSSCETTYNSDESIIEKSPIKATPESSNIKNKLSSLRSDDNSTSDLLIRNSTNDYSIELNVPSTTVKALQLNTSESNPSISCMQVNIPESDKGSYDSHANNNNRNKKENSLRKTKHLKLINVTSSGSSSNEYEGESPTDSSVGYPSNSPTNSSKKYPAKRKTISKSFSRVKARKLRRHTIQNYFSSKK